MNPKVVWTKWAVVHPHLLPLGGFRTAREAKEYAHRFNWNRIARCRGPQSALWATRLYVQQKLG